MTAYAHHARLTRLNQRALCDLPWGGVHPDSADWTADLSSWGHQTRPGAQPAPEAERGYFPLGNGRLYAAVGLGHQPPGLHDIIGPSYQKRPTRGTVATVLTCRGRRLPWDSHEVRWIRRSGVVRTESRFQDAILRTYDFVAPDDPILYRLCRLRRGPRTAPLPLDLTFAFARGRPAGSASRPAVDFGQIRMRPGLWRSRAIWRPRMPWEPSHLPARADPGAFAEAPSVPALVVPLGRGDGRPQTALLFLVAGRDDAHEAELWEKARAAQAATDALEACRESWADWMGQTCSVRTPDPRLSDLVDIQKRLIRVQQDAAGGYSPMDMYTYYWVRDATGPVRYMLRVGRAQEVRRSLDFWFRVCAARGAIGMNCALDAALAPLDARPDWDQAPVEEAETPSLTILQHYWYWRYTGDPVLIRSHYAFLRRCLLGQAVDDAGRLPFDGDETYRFPGYRAFESARADPPTDYVALELRSADSAFEYVAAAEGLAEMAAALARFDDAADFQQRARRVREATEQAYWQPDHGFYAPAASEFTAERHQAPFANINLSPLWIGYQSLDDAHATDNVLNAVRWLWREDGTARITPTFGYVTGMTPGMLLYSLAAIDHPAAEQALQGVLQCADPAGGYAEMLTPQNRPAGDDDVWGQRRARPWEGGINIDAVLYYLTGYEPDVPGGRALLCPRLPSNWRSFEAIRIPWGTAEFGLTVQAQENLRRYELSFSGSEHPDVTLVVSLPRTVVRSVKIEEGRLTRWWAPPRITSRFGQVRFPIHFRLHDGDKVAVSVEHDPTSATPPAIIPRDGPFPFTPPALGSATDLLLTCNKKTADRYRKKLGADLAVIDTNISFPAEYLGAALATETLRQVWLDVENYPGSFRTPQYWAAGPGGRALAKFRDRGGTVTTIPDPDPFEGRRRFE